MAILKRDEFFSRLETRLGDDTSDESISFLEDMTDTYNDLESRANNSTNTEWEQKYNELNETWKKRYRHRFFSGDNRGFKGEPDEPDDDCDNEITIDKLFKTERR